MPSNDVEDTPRGWPAQALWLLHRTEDLALAALLTTMVVLAPLQIVLRIFFDAAIAWADPALRALVLWVGLLGALAATRGGRHITIDVVSNFLPPRALAAVRVVSNAFAVYICGLLAWHGWRFIQSEWEFGSTAFASVPAWAVQSVIPFAFGLMSLRFALGLAAAARDVFSGGEEAETGPAR